MSQIVAAALRALDPADGRDYWRDLAVVARVLRECRDPDVEALLAPPMRDREAWGRLITLSDEVGVGGFVALDLKTEFQNPEAHDELRTGGEGEFDEAA